MWACLQHVFTVDVSAICSDIHNKRGMSHETVKLI